MGEDTTEAINDSRSFEERVFARFDAVDRRFDAIEIRIERLEMKQLDTKPIWERALVAIEETNAAMRNGFAIVGHAIDQINARLDSMDKRFDGVDARFEAMDKRFDGIDARFEAAMADGDSPLRARCQRRRLRERRRRRGRRAAEGRLRRSRCQGPGGLGCLPRLCR